MDHLERILAERRESLELELELATPLIGKFRHEEITKDMSTMARHEFMYIYAKQNELKGVFNGDCNVTQCQAPKATWYNTGTYKYYCEACAVDINGANSVNLCTPGTLPEPSVEVVLPASKISKPPRKLGRNDSCFCGSGKKYKKCCL